MLAHVENCSAGMLWLLHSLLESCGSQQAVLDCVKASSDDVVAMQLVLLHGRTTPKKVSCICPEPAQNTDPPHGCRD